jgi:arylsulfatase A-like enzyme
VTTKALEMLDILESSGERFLLFVHYFDPHYSYQRHDSYGFAPERVGRLAGGEDITLLRQLGDSLTADEIAFLRDLYDGEIRFTDDGIGQLMDALREKGLYDETLVVFVSDHGEEFLERGWLGHTRTLYDELIRVPLILRLPRATERRVIDEPVSLTSLAPTLLELLELPVPASFPAPSLVPQLRQRASSPDGAIVLSEVDFVPATEFNVRKTAKQASLVGPRYKLIRNDLEHRLELYDMQTDPAEAHDVAEKHPERVQGMAAQLDALLAQARAGAADAPVLDLSDEEIRALQALGYGE